MNIRDLKYLVAVSEHNHFGKAADSCFISQPALSMQIQKLEKVLGVQLIERTNKRVLLTEIGKVLTQHARDILYKVDSMHNIAKAAHDPFSGSLTLGIIPTLAPYLLPHIIPSIKKIFPKLMVYLIEETTPQLLSKLSQGKIDAALLALPVSDENFVTMPLFEEEFLLAVPHSHELSKRKKIKFSDLENQSLLLLEEGHCLRDQALAICHRINASETTSFQATSLETLRHMVASNVGITLMPKLAYQLKDAITYLSFHSPKPMRIIGLSWRVSSAKKSLLEKLLLEMRKMMSKQKSVKVIHTSIPCFN